MKLAVGGILSRIQDGFDSETKFRECQSRKEENDTIRSVREWAGP